MSIESPFVRREEFESFKHMVMLKFDAILANQALIITQTAKRQVTPRKRKLPADEEEPFNFAPEQIERLNMMSSSIPNLAKLMAERVFSYDERKNSNCSGTKGK